MSSEKLNLFLNTAWPHSTDMLYLILIIYINISMYLSQLSFDVSEHVKDYCFHWLQLFSITQMIVVECKEPKE